MYSIRNNLKLALGGLLFSLIIFFNNNVTAQYFALGIYTYDLPGARVYHLEDYEKQLITNLNVTYISEMSAAVQDSLIHFGEEQSGSIRIALDHDPTFAPGGGGTSLSILSWWRFQHNPLGIY